MTRGSYFDTRGLHFGSLLDLRARPAAPVGHFSPLSGNKYEKSSQIDLQLDLQMKWFSVNFHVFIILWVLWRELGGHLFLGIFLAVFSEFQEAEYGFDHSFTVPNAHHIFGSRHRFSEFVVPSGIHFGGSWIAFFCFGESFASSGSVRGCNTFLTPFWVDFLGSGQSRGNQPV